MPAAGLSRIHMDPESPVPGARRHGLVRELSDEAIDAFVGVAGPDSGSPLLLSELRQLGGALGRPAEGGGALSHLDAGYVMYGVGMPMTPGARRGDRPPPREARRDDEAPGGRGRLLQLHRRPCDVDAILPAEVCDRLREVKRRWDPDGRIVANHVVSLEA